MSDQDYSAGDGEDKIFHVFSDGNAPACYRNRGNALIRARGIIAGGKRAFIFNTETNRIELCSQDEFCGLPKKDKSVIETNLILMEGLVRVIGVSKQKLSDAMTKVVLEARKLPA